MILVGIGSNLTGAFESCREVCEAALKAMKARNIAITKRSSWYETEPVPRSSQPNYVNGVVLAEFQGSSQELLRELLAIEVEFGRTRKERNESRVLDLDLLAFNEEIKSSDFLMLPHPRLHERSFVLDPLVEIAPRWIHPQLGRRALDLRKSLENDYKVVKI